ncbi:UNVERIFIED_CONTAM: putative mitochondrial protein [Sesamum indicum]
MEGCYVTRIKCTGKEQNLGVSSLPQGKNTIGYRWIYKVKLRPDGSVERCKARLVAKGFGQVEGIDYNGCFAPAAKTVTEFTEKIKALGFTYSRYDYCLFTKGTGLHFIALLVYVDDILVAAAKDECIQEVKRYLNYLFTIKDLGATKYFLGFELARSPQGLIVTQNKYALDIIRDVGLHKGKSMVTSSRAEVLF